MLHELTIVNSKPVTGGIKAKALSQVLMCTFLAMSMATEKVSANFEVQEQTRGREEQHVQTRWGKSKAAIKDSLEHRVESLEQRVFDVEVAVGDLGNQFNNLVEENAEITKAAKTMFEEFGSTFMKELSDLWGFF